MGMKKRRHHNNTGYRRIKNGSIEKDVQGMAARLGVPYGKPVTGIRTKPEPRCPKCGAVMRLRRPTPSQDWSPFWGCSQYPDCRETRQIDEDTGLPERTDEEPPMSEGW